MKCWLCERGTNLDDGHLSPGEITTNFFGDPECIYCTGRIGFMADLMQQKPEVIKFVGLVQNAKPEGVQVGLDWHPDDDDE